MNSDSRDHARTWTADISDANPEAQVVDAAFASFGGCSFCIGPAELMTTIDDNSLVSKTLDEPGNGRVLVVDNNGSTSCAMLGGDLARKAAANGWAGVVVYGAVRDTVELREARLSVFALRATPRKSVKRGIGERRDSMQLPGARFASGDIVAADADGVLVVPKAKFVDVRS